MKKYITASDLYDFNGNHVAGVVLLVGPGKAQHDAVRFNRAELLEHGEVEAAEGPLQLQAVVAKAEVCFYRSAHASAPVAFHFAPQGRQGDGLGNAQVAGAVVKEVHVFEFAGHGHGGALLAMGGWRDGLGRAGWVRRR